MKEVEYSETELELAAEKILAELDGWDVAEHREQKQGKSETIEQFVRVLLSAMEQITAQGERVTVEEKTDTIASRTAEETIAMVRRQAGAEWDKTLSDNRMNDDAQMENVTMDFAQADSQEVSYNLRQKSVGTLQSIRTGISSPMRQLTLFGDGQQQLHTISDWIERDSRRYDSGFPVF
ncbi:MAG: hypothetical protein ACOX7K_09985 [Oscillospiraceae bacterium]|jgi:hypothetical protein